MVHSESPTGSSPRTSGAPSTTKWRRTFWWPAIDEVLLIGSALSGATHGASDGMLSTTASNAQSWRSTRSSLSAGSANSPMPKAPLSPEKGTAVSRSSGTAAPTSHSCDISELGDWR